MVYYYFDISRMIYFIISKIKEEITMATSLRESTIPQNLSAKFASINWDLNPEDCIWYCKTAVAGITDCLNIFKTKSAPTVVLVQDLKGNKIIYACVQFIPADDASETSDGNWTYYWSFDCDSIPENANIYTIDQTNVQTIIRDRGYDLCKLTMHDLTYISQLSVYTFGLIKDTLDQQDVQEGESWTVELEGYFEASVEVKNGVKEFSFLPKGEMKTLIKDDAGSEVA